jgi:hypothetical protein
MKPYIHVAGDIHHFQWNLDCSVGKGGSNNLACDVAYIQWYYTLAAANLLTTPDRRPIYQQVCVTGVCTGTDDDPLVAAILAHQQFFNHPVIDSRISVATGSGKVGASAFFIFRLGARLANMFPNLWPRLDLMPNCPTQVIQAVQSASPSV